MPKGFIKKIIIVHGWIIDSIEFQSDCGIGETESSIFGGKAVNQIHTICIDYPSEYLVSISGTIGLYGGNGVVMSLCFSTNQKNYGPFGLDIGTRFSYDGKGGTIVGFHGRVDKCLDAIGIYVMPESLAVGRNFTCEDKDNSIHEVNFLLCCSLSRMAMPREAGPWGAYEGKPWDDGVFSVVKKVIIHRGKFLNAICAIQFEYVKRDAKSVLSPIHGGTCGDRMVGKVALVTGGDSGIGRAVCYLFVKEGATVAFTFIKGQEDKDADDTLRLLLENKTGDAKNPIAIAADLGFDENCKKVVDEVIENFGRIDILVNNAAEQYKTTTIDEITEDRLVRVFSTNIFSQFFLCRHALKYMNAGSSIINTSSVDAYSGNPQLLDYTSTKGAIVAFTRGLALQLVQKGIRVNGVAPGPVYTPIRPASMEESDVSELGSENPMGRAAQPYEISPSFVFLASEDSTYFTGQFLHPNGGMIVNA